MAVSAANFMPTTQNRPSIFEIIAQKSLNDTLHPALRKLALFLSNNFPTKLNWLGQYYDEIFLVLTGVLQYNYLSRYDSTFSENFYGLQRSHLNNNSISNQQRYLSLVFAVIVPYFKRKLDEKIALYRLEEADGYLRNNLEGKFKKVLIVSHSAFEVTWNLLTIYMYLKYISGQKEAQTPLLKLLHLQLNYSEAVDENFGLKKIISNILTVGAFSLQFLHSFKEHKANFSLTALPLISPPLVDPRAKNYLGKCPLCMQVWRIPTVLPVSGYVFCFSCIVRHLREHQKCPVTNLSAKPLDIIRIYEQ